MVSFCLTHTDSQQIQWRNPFDTFETLEKHFGTFTLPYCCGFGAQSNQYRHYISRAAIIYFLTVIKVKYLIYVLSILLCRPEPKYKYVYDEDL